MSKVEDFLAHRLRKMGKTGEANFICCPVCRSEEWAVCCFSNGESPFIFALVCKTCSGQTVLTVEQGVIDNQPGVI